MENSKCRLCGNKAVLRNHCRKHYQLLPRVNNYPNSIVTKNTFRHDRIHIVNAKKILEYRCECCGSKKTIYLHHRDGDASNNPLNGSNWQFLCSSCHKFIHTRGYVPKNRELALIENKIKNMEIAKLKARKKALIYGVKYNAPPGFVISRVACDILNISRARLQQIRVFGRIEYKTYKKSYYYKPGSYIPKYIYHKAIDKQP